MRKVTKIVTCLTVATSLLLLGGCSSSSSSSDVVEIRFATWDSSEDLDDQQALVDAFNESHDDINVTLEAYGDDFDTKLSAGMGAGDAPDVMYMWNYPAYSEALEPLDSYIESEGEDYVDNFYEAVLEYNSLDGVLYGIPVGMSTHGLYYNAEIFEAAGLDVPDETWTWDDVVEAAAIITENVEDVYGFSYKMVPYIYDFEMFMWSNGTSYVDADGNVDGYLNSAESIEVLTIFQDMTIDGTAIGTSGSGYSEFASGQVAMYVNASWALSSATEAGLDYGVTEIPSYGDNESVSVVSTSGLAMSADSENKEAAWEFIKYWTSEELNVERLDYELSPLKSIVEEYGVDEDPLYEAFYAMLEVSDGYTPASFVAPDDWSEMYDVLCYAFERIYNPSTLEDPTTVMNEAVEELQ